MVVSTSLFKKVYCGIQYRCYICSHFICPVAVPLYQEYWLTCMKAELRKAQHKKLADIVEPRCRSAVPHPAATSPTCVPSPPGLHVAPYALWQQLPEVKRQNLLHTLTPRDIRHQEVGFYCSHPSAVISQCIKHSSSLPRPCLN